MTWQGGRGRVGVGDGIGGWRASARRLRLRPAVAAALLRLCAARACLRRYACCCARLCRRRCHRCRCRRRCRHSPCCSRTASNHFLTHLEDEELIDHAEVDLCDRHGARKLRGTVQLGRSRSGHPRPTHASGHNAKPTSQASGPGQAGTPDSQPTATRACLVHDRQDDGDDRQENFERQAGQDAGDHGAGDGDVVQEAAGVVAGYGGRHRWVPGAGMLFRELHGGETAGSKL